jgi:hypothetical protein
VKAPKQYVSVSDSRDKHAPPSTQFKHFRIQSILNKGGKQMYLRFRLEPLNKRQGG